ncbi:hypothetical protein NCAS_0B02010 [Naumovozyma castellii]|uniref:Major facilitator superfamily (MFS) profile domain-containing protein n=1 Tax=Naumovozyma castellii TaxID=27288 RepID=G0VBF9_NAUCA|nr:hypothetical protein NCAS_0B02010 [Naumovozyma castellii CBS 4309]CCC68285.1 hypothetical protein NCAS_0B02010 [Naumovozyma castellii CBS 4309]
MVPTNSSHAQNSSSSSETNLARFVSLQDVSISSKPDEILNFEDEDKQESNQEVTAVIPYTLFSTGQIYVIMFIITFIGFLGPLSGNIYIPALPTLQKDFNVSSTVINATVSVFMAVFAVGPLFWGLFADVGGRKVLYICSILLMVIVNILLASIPAHISSLFVLRIVQAFGSSSVITLGAGTVTDITPPKQRGRAIGYFMIGPNMGPVLAPIIAGLILMKGNYWRWLFGLTGIMGGVGLLLIVAFLPETLRCIVGNADPGWDERRLKLRRDDDIEFSRPIRKTPRWTFFTDLGIQKPRNTTTEFKELYPKPPRPNVHFYWDMLKFPPVVIASVSTALLFSNYYALSVSLSHFLERDYKLSMLKIGLSYVCPGVCMIFGSQLGGHLSDHLRARWIKTHEGQSFPLESRLVLHICGILINTAGCIGYGWAIQKHFHLAIVLLFSGLMAFGLTWCSNTTMTYLSELMTTKTAGAIALSSFFRNVGAAISSSIILILCKHMGIGWCFTGLGLCNIISLVLIGTLLKYGNKWKMP